MLLLNCFIPLIQLSSPGRGRKDKEAKRSGGDQEEGVSRDQAIRIGTIGGVEEERTRNRQTIGTRREGEGKGEPYQRGMYTPLSQ